MSEGEPHYKLLLDWSVFGLTALAIGLLGVLSSFGVLVGESLIHVIEYFYNYPNYHELLPRDAVNVAGAICPIVFNIMFNVLFYMITKNFWVKYYWKDEDNVIIINYMLLNTLCILVIILMPGYWVAIMLIFYIMVVMHLKSRVKKFRNSDYIINSNNSRIELLVIEGFYKRLRWQGISYGMPMILIIIASSLIMIPIKDSETDWFLAGLNIGASVCITTTFSIKSLATALSGLSLLSKKMAQGDVEFLIWTAR